MNLRSVVLLAAFFACMPFTNSAHAVGSITVQIFHNGIPVFTGGYVLLNVNPDDAFRDNLRHTRFALAENSPLPANTQRDVTLEGECCCSDLEFTTGRS